MADTELARDEHRTLMSAEERYRRTAFLHVADQVRFTTAAALLRLAVSERVGTPPADVLVDRRCSRCAEPHGKPQLPGTGLHASVSHSGSLVAVALTAAAPVGVDVEQMLPKDIAGLSRLCLAPSETLERDEDFFTYWCRKESVVKATGDGLGVPLAHVVVSPAGQAAKLVEYPGGTLNASMADLSVGPGYCGAVTVLTDCPLAVVVRDATGLLATAGGSSLPKA